MMKFRKSISAALAAVICLCSPGSIALAATAGSAEDPLISKSYVDSTWSSSVSLEPSEFLSESLQVMEYKLAQAKSIKAPDSTYFRLLSGSTLSLQTGSGFVLVSGSAKLTRATGAVLDLTTGSVISSGATLTAAHKYLAAENSTASVAMSSAGSISTIGTVTVSGVSMTFADVPEDSWYYEDTANAVSKGLINGYNATTFAPENNLTIGETIKLAACMYQLYHDGRISLSNYADSSQWYKTYVDFSLEKGIISASYPNYNAVITRREYVHIFYHALPASEYAAINSIQDGAVSDIASGSSYYSELYTFYRAGILTGYEDGTFRPESNIRRCEVAAVLSRMFDAGARKKL